MCWTLISSSPLAPYLLVFTPSRACGLPSSTPPPSGDPFSPSSGWIREAGGSSLRRPSFSIGHAFLSNPFVFPTQPVGSIRSNPGSNPNVCNVSGDGRAAASVTTTTTSGGTSESRCVREGRSTRPKQRKGRTQVRGKGAIPWPRGWWNGRWKRAEKPTTLEDVVGPPRRRVVYELRRWRRWKEGKAGEEMRMEGNETADANGNCGCEEDDWTWNRADGGGEPNDKGSTCRWNELETDEMETETRVKQTDRTNDANRTSVEKAFREKQ